MSDKHIKSSSGTIEEQIYNSLIAAGFNDKDAKFLARMYAKQDKIEALYRMQHSILKGQ